MCKLRWRLALFLLRKEVQDMAIVYATLIIKGRKTIDQVPALLRKQVEETWRLRSNSPASRRGASVWCASLILNDRRTKRCWKH